MGDTVCFSEFGPLTVEITTLRLVLRRGFVLSEYISGDYNVCEREERIPMPELSPETNGEERERWKKPLV